MTTNGAMLVLRSPSAQREWTLGEETVIGRDETCDVVLEDRLISRRHARILRSADGYLVMDAGSKNGTWLNGVRLVEPTRLADGDELSVAARFKLYFVDSEATAPLVFQPRGLRVDPASKSVYVNGEPLEPPLSVPQYELLAALVEAAGQTVSREILIDRVWPYTGGDGVTDQALDALVRRVRARLAEADPEQSFVATVRGYGYRLATP